MSVNLRTIDVRHLGRPGVVACFQLGGVLVDPGPGSSVTTLFDELGDDVPEAIFLTHIHLDHAGATGALVRRWPHLRVVVHERGARHLADPAKLIAPMIQRFMATDRAFAKARKA